MAASIFAPALFVFLWVAHGWLVERSRFRGKTLSFHMNEQRRKWIKTMAAREMRMIDTNIVSGLQSGTAFFASTSLLAIGGAFTLLNSAERFVEISASLPIPTYTDETSFEIKAIGLMVLYAYAFMKFGWAYRLFNYTSILIGAVPMPGKANDEETSNCVERASAMSVEAGREFNRGQRVFFIAIGYLGWFFGDLFFIASMLAVFGMMIARQFLSPARAAMMVSRN